jgi:FkbM family methyltransferase
VNVLLQKSVSLVPWRLRNAVKKLPLLAPLQRRLLRRFLEGREFVHTVDAGPARGLKYLITLPQDKGIWTGTYELGLAERVAQAVRPGDICLDVGGWRGFFSGVMAVAGASRVIVFEPLPQNVLQIRRMIELNPALPIEVVEAAIADHVSTTSFQVMSETSMAKLGVSNFQPEARVDKRIEVRLETLDNLRATGIFSCANVVKIDVEGAEAMVLRGASRMLAMDHPQLFIEIHSRALARECAEILLGYHYAVEVSETGRGPDFRLEPQVCHFVATWESEDSRVSE